VQGQLPLAGEGDAAAPDADRPEGWEAYNSDILNVFFDV
jgi:hypothetical protein